MARTTETNVRAVQSRLQDLLDDLPEHQAVVLESVLAGTPLEVDRGAAPEQADGQDRAIIIVSGRRGRVLVFDLGDVLDELNPQPLPPEPPEAVIVSG